MEQSVEQKHRGWLMALVYVDWAHRKRMLKREAWLAIGVAYGLLTMAWIAPGSFETSSMGSARLGLGR